MRFCKGLTVLVVLLIVCPSHDVPADGTGARVLEVAKRVAEERFPHWTYGSDPKKQQVDCVQFLVAVLEELLPGRLDSKTRRQILIANLTDAERRRLDALVSEEHPKIQGVRTALTAIGWGKPVQPNQVRAGDFIQYWIRRSDGRWAGHAAIVEKVRVRNGQREVKLYGAHRSIHGIGTIGWVKLVHGSKRKIFLVRLKSLPGRKE